MNAAQRAERREERKATKNSLHSAEKVRYGSPNSVVAIAHAVFEDRITVDPFSETAFNERVQATRILTGERGLDGFADRWVSHPECPRADHLLADWAVKMRVLSRDTSVNTAFVNPPGSSDGQNVKRAWKLLDTYHWLNWLDGGAMWVGFNLNQLQTTQGESSRSVLHGDFVKCVPSARESFVDEHGVEEDQPTHPCFFVLLPSVHAEQRAKQVETFKREAGKLGEVWT